MYWALFAYLIIPAGALLMLMLVSGMKWLVDVAAKMLNTPLRIHSVHVSLDLMMTGFCSILGMLAYSSMQRAESLLAESRKAQSLAAMRANQDELQRNVAIQDRNFWLSILGLTLWGVAWRLKTLFVSETIAVQPRKNRRTLQSRLKYAGFALLCFALADVPLCRLNYSVQLASFITPNKATLLDFGKRNGCRDVMRASAQGECAKFCTEARKLADDRLWAVNWTRNWHIFGKYAAVMFDGFRNVQQGQERIEGLFAGRPCEKVLLSVDKSNQLVNLMCVAFTGISIIGCLISIQNALSSGVQPPRPTVGSRVTILSTDHTREHCRDEIGKQFIVSDDVRAYQVAGPTARLYEADMKLVEEASSKAPTPTARGPAVAVPAKETPVEATADMPAARQQAGSTVKATAKKDNVTD